MSQPSSVPFRTAMLDAAGNLVRTWIVYFQSFVTHATGPLAAGSLVAANDTGDILTADLTGDVTTAGSTAVTLAPSGVAAGVYGDAANVPQVTIDAKGRVTLAANVPTLAITSLTGDVTTTGAGAAAATVKKINGVALSGLATGILKNTTTTGVPSIAVAADITGLIQTTGTFTPALLFGGAAVGMTTALTAGAWCRVGQLITVTVAIVLTAKGSSTGAATITGLPFATGAGGGAWGGTFGFLGNMATLVNPYVGATAGTTVLLLRDGGTGTSISLSEANFTNTSNVQISISYFI